MMSSCQKTLSRDAACVGEGVHTGQVVTLTLHPAPADHGIVFERLDVPAPHNRIRALWENVKVSPLCTQITNAQGIEVRTIEHLMAALHASGVDNALITVDGPEVPILDGSAASFFELVLDAGIRTLQAPRRFIKIMKRVEVRHGDAVAVLEPAESPTYAISVAYPQHKISEQIHSLDFDETGFSDVAAARTFGFESDIEALRAKGLTLGGSLDNAIVIDREGDIVNPEGYRFENELARHKLLDAIGDLSLAGAVIIGHFKGERSGHALNNALLRALFADATASVDISGESHMGSTPAETASSQPYSR
jgi:UDP-3-O-[3-hydroxymyristoyl] N-acetylglucosamine deacetylase